MKVIVCGAGIAGLATALRLDARGVEVTLLERSPAPRPQGYMIDFFGPGYEAVRAWGLLPAVRERGYRVTSATYRDAHGRVRARIDYDVATAALGDNLTSIMRPDLESVLREALPVTVGIEYGAAVHAVHQDGDGVTVSTSDGRQRHADLLVGADGVHSTVRRLVFGPERHFLRYLGFHTAAYAVADARVSREVSEEFALTDSVNRMLGCYRLRDGRVAVFAVHRTADPTMPDDARTALQQTYAGLGWVTPELLAACPPSEQVFYDQVAQVVMPRWFRGRVVLVGDACGAVSLLAGQGASMAVTGAHVLAEHLASAADTGDVPAALGGYQDAMRPLIEDRQASGRRTARWFVPATGAELIVRRVLLAAARAPWVSRLVARRLAGKPTGTRARGARAPITSHKPTGLLRAALRLPIWLYRAHLGWLLGHRMIYLAHRGRRSGRRHEVVVEVVRYDGSVPEVLVIAAWGGTPDWYRNLRANPAIEVRTGRHRWSAPVQRFPDAEEIERVLRAYRRAHPTAFGHLAPRLGFPADPDDPRWPEVAARVHAIAFRPAG